MSAMQHFKAARLFDGNQWHDGATLGCEGGSVSQIIDGGTQVSGADVTDLGAGFIVPGFVDLQVNGGGGVLFNDATDSDALERLCAAHFQFGSTALLPTLITDTPSVTRAAIAAGLAAQARRIRGFEGLHLEGPHLSVARKGAHNPGYIRPMEQADLDTLMEARAGLATLLTTIAPESVATEQTRALAEAGLIVSLGHSDASYETASAHFAAGATMVTHLFNAMSQLGSREPGIVGAALDHGIWAGLIADGHHVAPGTISVAMRGKKGPGRIFLVTDAMSTIGTDLERFTLNGREIVRADGALRLADGTLAGADLTMIDAVRYMHKIVGISLQEALRMASLYPAQAIGQADRLGQLGLGAEASFVHLSDALDVLGVWIKGERVV